MHRNDRLTFRWRGDGADRKVVILLGERELDTCEAATLLADVGFSAPISYEELPVSVAGKKLLKGTGW